RTRCARLHHFFRCGAARNGTRLSDDDGRVRSNSRRWSAKAARFCGTVYDSNRGISYEKIQAVCESHRSLINYCFSPSMRFAGRDVPAYIIFADVALREMARAYPTTTAEFGRIPGVGQQKLRDFAEPFTTAIAEYLTKRSRQSAKAIEA